MIEQNVDFFTLSQIKLFATHIKFRKSNRQHLKNQQTVWKFPEIHARQFESFCFSFTPAEGWREEAAIHLIPTYNGGAIHANAKDKTPTIRPTTT